MTRFVHLTDLHLSDPAMEDPHLYSDTGAALDRVVALIARMDPAPDFVAVSGDMTNHGDADSYRLLKDKLAGIAVPVIHAMGNHDNRGPFREVFDPDDATDPEAPLFHHAPIGGLHVITLDSSVSGRVGGEIGPAQFDLLEAALNELSDMPKLVICHHPPRLSGGLVWEALSQEETDRLGAILEGRNVAGLLCGHVHFNRVALWRGVPVVISMGLHNTVDVLEPADMVVEEGTGFALCSHGEDGLDVTFVPLTPDRRQLGRIPEETLRSFS